MSKQEWLKVITLILVPINVWLFVLYRHQKQKETLFYPSLVRYESDSQVRMDYFAQKWGIEEGQRMLFPFPLKGFVTTLGKPTPFGQGIPILFLNSAWIAYPEVWEPTIKEILKVPSLHLTLLFSTGPYHVGGEQRLKQLREMLKQFPSTRIAVIAGEQIDFAFGSSIGGILAILCDGKGIVRIVEPYPKLKLSPYWKEEVADWRPKLHQAVKKVLDSFFQKKEQGK